jgi:hypothetical protein
MLLTSPPLVDQLARRLEAVCRLRSAVRGWRQDEARQRHLDEVLCEARAAIASGERAALERALASVDLLSLELCDD